MMTGKCQVCGKPTHKIAVFPQTENAMELCADHARVIPPMMVRMVLHGESELCMLVSPEIFQTDYTEYTIDPDMPIF